MPPLKKNEKVMLVIIGIFIVIFIIMDPYYFIWKDPPAPEGGVQAAEGIPEETAAAATKEAGKTTRRGTRAVGATMATERIELHGWKRDPFVRTRPYIDKVSSLSEFTLGAISVGKTDRYALINSKILRQGDEVGGMTVDRIERDKVILIAGGRSYTLTWEE